MFNEIFEPVKAVLIRVQHGELIEIVMDLSTKTSQITEYLGGPATFIGQWPEHEVVILKCSDPVLDPPMNQNVLAEPFTQEQVLGSILLIRMDQDAIPRDLTLEEVLEHKLVLTALIQRTWKQPPCEL